MSEESLSGSGSLELRSGRIKKPVRGERRRSERALSVAQMISRDVARDPQTQREIRGSRQDGSTISQSAPGSRRQTTFKPAQSSQSHPSSDSTQALRLSRAEREMASMRFPSGISTQAPKPWSRNSLPEQAPSRSRGDKTINEDLGEKSLQRDVAGAYRAFGQDAPTGQPYARAPRARLNPQNIMAGLPGAPEHIPGLSRLGTSDLQQLATDLRLFPEPQKSNPRSSTIQTSFQAMTIDTPIPPSQRGVYIPPIVAPIPSNDALHPDLASLTYSIAGHPLPPPRDPLVILRKLQLADARAALEQAKIWYLSLDVGSMGQPLGMEQGGADCGPEVYESAREYVAECERALMQAELNQLGPQGSRQERKWPTSLMDPEAKSSPRLVRR